ncbi:deoxynucleotide monophosphate kinase family protein [Streptomyces hygroscopicus]|uniref:deoxynucleotide monophosphate kinase family protein n=1 Tax=Streptomyces hygroscopicus TaxID=1912 RepID=UPI0007679F24|nr:hypothetical protein [Streptomyces hygroscopicus]GLV78343.1 hypothetical protein Shyhy02_63430 [Streptomyces hygroscopicus subsp. hygroscopicus]
MGNIGIIGRARSGKDTAGKYFVEQHGYRRVALADPIKEAALRTNPIVKVDHAAEYYRLAEDIAEFGWERAKDDTAEVRRILQELSAAIRALDEDFWLRLALKATEEANDAGAPVIITDIRYPNEAASLARAGFHLLHINRPGIPQMDHVSEKTLRPEDARYLIRNDGTLDDFHAQLARVWDAIYAVEQVV